MVVDTHAHVYKENYDNIDLIIANAKTNGIKKIINCGESIKTSKEVISLSKYNDIFACAIGIHPERALDTKQKDINDLEELINKNKVIAIGEIGLDYHYETNKTKQIVLFESQLSLAKKYNLPVIIHSRDATEDTIKTLKKYNLKGIIHCFTGSYETAQIYIKMGFLLGIGGAVTFKNSKLIDVLKRLKFKNIVFETDCPFLTPEPYRKYKNEPAYIVETIKYVSEKTGNNYKDIAYITNSNVCRVFDIDF